MHWFPCIFFSEACNYLLVYEYVIMADIQSDTWGGVNRAITTKGLHSTSTRGANRTLLLGGRRDGHICVFDWETGDVEFEIEVSVGLRHPVNSSLPEQNDHHFADDIFKCIFMNEKLRILIQISLKFAPEVPIDIKPVLVQIMAWRRTSDKPLSEPMLIQFTDAYLWH